MVSEAIDAGGEANTVRAIDAFVREFEPDWPEAAAKLTEQRAELRAFNPARSLDHNVHFKPLLEKVLGEAPGD